VRLFYQPLQKLASRSSEITIFQNLDDANQFRSSGIVKQENTIVIPGSGVDTSEFSAAHVPEIERIRVRNDLQISLDAFVVTMISRLIRSKGVMDFVKAAEYLQQHKSDIKFLLIGPLDEDSLDRLNPQELELLKRNVIWPGFRKDIRTILCASDLFVLPSYYREGVPRVLLEAAAMELPMITADSPGCIEVITNNVNGLLIPPQNPEALAQAISRLARDYEKRRTLGLAARRTVTSQFDISIIASEIGTLYLRLLSKRNGASEAIPRI
jgi:glycosyltransferase involved in cell wall biosynthesis